jgi:hypothetical protein
VNSPVPASIAKPSSAALVPPRPNLGPEPMAETNRPGWVTWVTVAVVLALLVVATRRRRTRQKPVVADTTSHEATESSDLVSPRERLIAQADLIRSVLVARFGESWRAKTTEEIAAMPDLFDALDPESAARLIAFLRESDRAKFAAELIANHQGEVDAWDGWVTDFVAAAGPRSTIKGKWSEPTNGPSRRETTARSSETKA